jgi:flavin-dependent dehydrogenase
MPPYAGALNYGYHLDATKLAALLARHAVERLGVGHLTATVTGVLRDGDYIVAVDTGEQGEIEGDLFIDCSGFRAVLIGEALGVGWTDLSGELLNDRALAVQLPIPEECGIASETIATAHEAGWLWDIALPTRRGIGCVYSSAHMSDDAAVAALREYLGAVDAGVDLDKLSPRLLRFPTGHRQEFWKGNCLAVGLSAGFIEPLEASAIMLVEMSLRALADNFPRSAGSMTIHADRFNRLFALRWRRIVDFLKLHYVLSQRDGDYWRAQRDPSTLSSELGDLLALWDEQPPSAYDFPLAEEVFPAASHQYVYFGMRGRSAVPAIGGLGAADLLEQVYERGRRLSSTLPTNRVYLDRLRSGAMATRSAI